MLSKKPGKLKPKLMLILAIGAGTSAGTYYLTSSNRYSIAAEYNIVNACVEASRGVLSSSQYERKIKTCSCMLENTQGDVDESEIYEAVFRETFRKSAVAC